jgi:hypothetical protein
VLQQHETNISFGSFLEDMDTISLIDVHERQICRQSVEAVPSLSVLSNSLSVINTNHGPYKLSEWKQHAQNNRLLSQLCTGDLYYNTQLQKTDRARNE